MSRIRRKASKHSERRTYAPKREAGLAQRIHEQNVHLPSGWVSGPNLLNRHMGVVGERRSYMRQEGALAPIRF
jgi:hypothetical protein